MIRLTAALSIAVATCSIAAAEQWPSRPVTLVVPLAAGGGSDGLIRVVTPRLSEIIGQSVIVENVGGAGGMIGAARVAKAAPDGYQMLLGTSGTQATNQSIYAKPLYDAATDFTPVALIFEVPQVLLVKKDLPVNDLKEFAAYAKANQSTMQFGSSGVGGTGHLGCLLLNNRLGVDVTHVPYRGGGPAMQDLVAGRIDYQCALANLAMPQIEGKNVKAIAMLTPERSPLMRDIPSLGEQGLTDFDASAWNVIVLPKDTPRDIVDTLHKALFEALDTPAVRDRLAQMGASVVAKERRSPAYLQKWTEAEIAKWATIVKSAGIAPQ
jgi:tripartite-type tricarboxylate transporter receptor subunit TctC